MRSGSISTAITFLHTCIVRPQSSEHQRKPRHALADTRGCCWAYPAWRMRAHQPFLPPPTKTRLSKRNDVAAHAREGVQRHTVSSARVGRCRQCRQRCG